MDRIIFHIDVNSAFLSWEAVYRLHHLGGKVDLRKERAAVGGDSALRHGIILAKSMETKPYGIRTGDSIWEAREKCPRLLIVPPNYGLYEKCSEAFMRILRKYTPAVEQYSIDEAFLDMTGMEKLWGKPVDSAGKIREEIEQRLGFTVNIGISSNKLLAKMASDFQKPNRVHTLFPEEIREKMWPLDVGELFFVGRKTRETLYKLGIRSIGELAGTDPEILKDHLKKQGEVIFQFANGRDVSPVLLELPEKKGYGNSATLPFDVTDASTAKLALLSLAETLGARLRAEEAFAGRVSVGIRTRDFFDESHQRTLENPTNITEELHRHACRLFDELWDGTPVRKLGIYTGNIQKKVRIRQENLFDRYDHEKLKKMNQTVDQIRKRYGMDALKRASLLKGPLDHMGGGISREKRSVDYSKVEVR